MDTKHLILAAFFAFHTLSTVASGKRKSDRIDLSGKSLKVSSILIEPYLMVRSDMLNTTGNNKYYGYIADLLSHLSQLSGFTYQIIEAQDGSYGYKQSDGTWDGMIGQVISKEVDIAAGPLYITENRKQVVSFTTPFMAVKATILLRRPPSGGDLKIKSITDLINQSEIKYGTLEKGIIVREFKKTNETESKMLYRNMLRYRPSVFTSTNEEGIQKVRQDKYAFVLPDTIGDYIASKRPCDLVTMGKFLMQKGYGLALPKYSNIFPQINRGVRILRRKNILNVLQRKWWLEQSTCNGIKSSKIYSHNIAIQTYSLSILEIVVTMTVYLLSLRIL